MKFKEKNVLITGGASGIGKIMGRKALERGANALIIWDINPANIEQTINELGTLGTVKGYKVDVSNADNVAQTYEQVKKEVGDVNVLINCAGVVRGNRTFDQQTVNDIKLTMDINATAPMLVTLAILPDMLKRNEGNICNIASAAGMLGVPRLSTYVASKWAVVGWCESMRVELKEMRSKVHVTCVAPYFINTGMFNGVASPIFPILDPEKTAEKIVKAIERQKDFKGIPFPFHFIRFWQAVLPLWLFDAIFGTVFGVYHTMDHFTGRKA